MLKTSELYYFSPTGGTKKVGQTICEQLAECYTTNDLMREDFKTPTADIIVIAAPVFAGRIPAAAIEKIKKLNGSGKKAVTIAVYGNRAYEDALLELNDTAKDCGFQVIASAALVAQHSIVPEVAAGRPDAQDNREIQSFADKVSAKIEKGDTSYTEVPGNHPYKEAAKMPATPVCTAECGKCGACAILCPTNAIEITKETVTTNPENCILCMACVAHCPKQARILPAPVQAAMNEKLEPAKAVRNVNEFFL